ncbi:hypothetical protein J437_LFUL010585 [Ladona fulva]|uniref:RING-type domain-containing protein n=1 Tax=Ladona fulva TaxID=123851 RepID=A0A8K0KBR0_LADFU|nr:hypothetical protein J437_LFUL010585 [Ladona fulva]
MVKEHLTCSNCPSCVCAVCLYGFQQGDAFSKTECFHYFHSHCLACYVRTTQRNLLEEREKLPLWQQQQMQKDRLNLQKEQQDEDSLQVPCPVCREPISADLDALSSAAPPIALEAAPPFELTNELRDLQHQMAALYMHQKSQGGIIDVNADQSKLLLLTSGSAESTRNSSDVASSARSSARQSGSEQSRASKSIRGSSWSNAGSQPKRSWKVRSEPPSQVVNSSKGMPPVQSEFGLGEQESFERPFPEGQDAEGESRECIKGGEGWRNGGRGGRGGRWSYHRSRGRRASRGRLRMACNLAPSS